MAKLRLPAEQVRAQLLEALESAQEVAGSGQDVAVLRTAFETWDKRNEILLERAFKAEGFLGTSPKSDYMNAIGLEYPFGPAMTSEVHIQGLEKDLGTKVARLRKILDTLDAYGADVGSETQASSAKSTIFIVHGRPDAPRLEVELLIRRATKLEPVVLGDQVNAGATLVEKLEEHLAGTSFAVVIMTGDDQGSLSGDGQELKPRARQNVVLELGFAMGSLGRRKVAILHEDGLDLPSDIVGVAYYPLDGAGAWKQHLLGELQAAGIDVDSSALINPH